MKDDTKKGNNIIGEDTVKYPTKDIKRMSVFEYLRKEFLKRNGVKEEDGREDL